MMGSVAACFFRFIIGLRVLLVAALDGGRRERDGRERLFVIHDRDSRRVKICMAAERRTVTT